jgi:Domain of unknown function (DUF397)
MDWRTSSYSANNGACAEVASGVLVRDAKDRGGPVLEFTPAAWLAFTGRVKVGDGA